MITFPFLSRHFSRSLALSVAGLALGLASSLHAQQDQATAAQIATHSDLTNRGGTGTEEPNAQFVISDPNLGDIDLVSRVPRPKMFTFSTSQTFSYTTNAFLTENHTEGAFFWDGRFDASFVPYATRNFTPRLTFEQSFFRYSRFSSLDFNSQTLQADFKFDLNRNDTWWINGSLGVSRLADPHGSDGAFYRYGLAGVSVNHYLPIPNSPVYLICSGGVYDRSGDASAFDRVAPYLVAAAAYRPIDQVQLSAYLRPEGQFYTNDPLDSSRTDFNLSLGSAVAWTPNQYVSVGASLSFVGNYSNAAGRSYNVFSPSVAVGAQISF